MAKAEWGTKRNCPKCGAKFYDLKKNPAECPACHYAFDPEALQKKKPKRKSARSLEDVKPAKALAGGAAAKKKGGEGEDQEIDLPEFEDLGIIEDMDDIAAEVLDEVEAIPTKTASTDDEEDEEAFLDEGEIEIEDEEDEDK